MLTAREIPASYADREWFNPLLKMHILGHSFALNAYGYFTLSTYNAFLAGKLKDFASRRGKLSGLWPGFSGSPPGSIYC